LGQDLKKKVKAKKGRQSANRVEKTGVRKEKKGPTHLPTATLLRGEKREGSPSNGLYSIYITNQQKKTKKIS